MRIYIPSNRVPPVVKRLGYKLIFRQRKVPKPDQFIGAVAAFTNDRRGTIKWTPLDECYREKHRESKKTWTHPYRARTLPLGVKCG